jgi:predicted glycogen debranching enzyme
LQNTVQVIYRLLEGSQPMTLRLHPFMHFHPQAMEVSPDFKRPYLIEAFGNRFEVKAGGEFPDLRLFLHAAESSFNLTGGAFSRAFYRIEKERGYAAADLLWTPGFFSARLAVGEEAVLVASTEAWEILLAFDPAQAREAELFRRQQLVDGAPPSARKEPAVNLVLGSDQFVIAPVARVADAARAHARGDEVRSVIAGYHWFTDWGRDTMISLEGLTLATGRCTEAGYILRTFANYVRDGLIPNMFPEGDEQGVYYTSGQPAT